MRALILLLSLGALGAAACVTATTSPPDELAADIVVALDAGERARADALFDSVAKDATYSERVYPVVFGAARQRFESGEYGAAAERLDFLADAYPRAGSVRAALLYSLFLQRAGGETTPALADALESAAGDVRETSSVPPVWVDLIDAQVAIDGGHLPAAQQSYDRFLASWNGTPATLTVYVEDLGRYLATH
jgi:hypothetical protein